MAIQTANKLHSAAPPIAVIVLAGGHSRRWCSSAAGAPEARGDKALAIWNGKPLLEHALAPFEQYCAERIVVLRRAQRELIARLEQLPDIASVWDDESLPEGPLRGAIGGLQASRAPLAFITGCDYPAVNPAFLRLCLERLAPDADLIAAQWDNHLQPFPALYRRTALPKLEALLSAGVTSISAAIQRLNARIVPAAECAALDPAGATWLNFNRQSAALDRSLPRPSTK